MARENLYVAQCYFYSVTSRLSAMLWIKSNIHFKSESVYEAFVVLRLVIVREGSLTHLLGNYTCPQVTLPSFHSKSEGRLGNLNLSVCCYYFKSFSLVIVIVESLTHLLENSYLPTSYVRFFSS